MTYQEYQEEYGRIQCLARYEEIDSCEYTRLMEELVERYENGSSTQAL